MGTASCGFLVWFDLMYCASLASLHGQAASNQSADYLLAALIVLLSYGGVFLVLDRWWLKYSAAHTATGRPNWLVIPFAGAFFALLNAYLLFPVLCTNCPATHWLMEATLASLSLGLKTWFVMLVFWALGFRSRYLNNS